MASSRPRPLAPEVSLIMLEYGTLNKQVFVNNFCGVIGVYLSWSLTGPLMHISCLPQRSATKINGPRRGVNMA